MLKGSETVNRTNNNRYDAKGYDTTYAGAPLMNHIFRSNSKPQIPVAVTRPNVSTGVGVGVDVNVNVDVVGHSKLPSDSSWRYSSRFRQWMTAQQYVQECKFKSPLPPKNAGHTDVGLVPILSPIRSNNTDNNTDNNTNMVAVEKTVTPLSVLVDVASSMTPTIATTPTIAKDAIETVSTSIATTTTVDTTAVDTAVDTTAVDTTTVDTTVDTTDKPTETEFGNLGRGILPVLSGCARVVKIGSRVESFPQRQLARAKSCIWKGVEFKANQLISVLSSSSSATRAGVISEEDLNPLRRSRARINSIHFLTGHDIRRWVLNVRWAFDVDDLGHGMEADIKEVGMTSNDFALSIGAAMKEYIFLDESDPQLLRDTEFKFTFHTKHCTLAINPKFQSLSSSI
jgi:hypothetical protein